jgi:hypothetical protein
MDYSMNTKGFVTAVSVVVSLAILVFFSGIYYILQTSTRENIVIEARNRSDGVAESAVQEIINVIRANPTLNGDYGLEKSIPKNDGTTDLVDISYRDGNPDAQGFFDIYIRNYPRELKDSSGKTMGYYFAKAKVIKTSLAPWSSAKVFVDERDQIVTGDVFHIVTEGWAVDRLKRPQSHAITHAFVQLTNVGDYFCAVKGQLNIRPGSQLAQSKVYGRNLVFDLDKANPSKLKDAHYSIDYVPEIWPGPGLDGLANTADDDPGFGGIEIEVGRLSLPDKRMNVPRQLEAPLVFPSVTDQVGYYASQPASRVPRVCNFNGSDIVPPSITNTVHDNKDHAYYCDDSVNGTVIQNIVVKGQVIIASSGPVKIKGNITIPDPDLDNPVSWNGEGQPAYNGMFGTLDNVTAWGNLPSKANQLVIYAPKGVIIDGNWCNIGATAPELKLQGVLIIAPDDTLKYDPGAFTTPVTASCMDFATYKLDFVGAMFLSDQPTLGGVFKASRNYRDLATLRSDPPPIREFFQVLKQFTIRRASPAPTPS